MQFESMQIEALEFRSERASTLEVSSEREEWQIWATVTRATDLTATSISRVLPSSFGVTV